MTYDYDAVGLPTALTWAGAITGTVQQTTNWQGQLTDLITPDQAVH